MSAQRMRQWSRAKAIADGSRPGSAPQDLSMDGLMPRCQGWQGAAHMQKYPEVRTRSRTVQRASGGTRRCVLNDEDTVFARVKPSCSTVFARVNIAEKHSAPEPDIRTDPLSTQEAFFRVAFHTAGAGE
ncbi:hypothetical protein Desor_3987 [Desulfosporosinus orientis DSM 765]|uniref:Uncharacterized protein n=1 Tax=Desulfosporosinus orientis (strain ATCC 19365 / DSM 765 / NCIMB 8382 / VKM B-1628 / Singapore I) TaxID=768706 RepID=G7WE33_DESOD|nr:hypothetical protein Desor_3987 [Desulfosporosinus orientis DSM 765]